MNRFISVLAVVLIAFSTAVFADEEEQRVGSQPQGQQFEAVDQDGNRKIDEQEASVVGIDEEMFKKLDTDQDGDLSKKEYSKAWE